MAAKISISIPNPRVLEWAQRTADAQGKSVSAVFTELAERELQLEALRSFLDGAGAPKTLSVKRAAEIRAEVEGDAPARARESRRKRKTRARRR